MKTLYGKKILILVAHPDDEVVACCAAIGRAKSEGAEFYALYLTHGCVDRESMWPWARPTYGHVVGDRRAEAKRAAEKLGVTPVGWSMRAARHLWQQMNAAYTEIRNAVRQYDIDQLWVPAYEGGNPDHDALNALAQLFKDRLSVLEFAEYNFAGRRTMAQTFPRANGTEQHITLSGEERAAKKHALALYRSERMNLNYVGTERECFRPLAAYDYSQPPHAGILWYARFQWVPFRHPQVDFTDPADVRKAIGAFLQKHPPELRKAG